MTSEIWNQASIHYTEIFFKLCNEYLDVNFHTFFTHFWSIYILFYCQYEC